MLRRQGRGRFGEFEVDREGVVAEILTQGREIMIHVHSAAARQALGLLRDDVSHEVAQDIADIEFRRGELLRQQHEDGRVGPVGARQSDEAFANGLQHVERAGFGSLDAIPQELERLPGHERQGRHEGGRRASSCAPPCRSGP